MLKRLFSFFKGPKAAPLSVRGLYNMTTSATMDDMDNVYRPAPDNYMSKAQAESNSTIAFNGDMVPMFANDIMRAVHAELKRRGETGQYDLGMGTQTIVQEMPSVLHRNIWSRNKYAGFVVSGQTMENKGSSELARNLPLYNGVNTYEFHHILASVMSPADSVSSSAAQYNRYTNSNTPVFNHEAFQKAIGNAADIDPDNSDVEWGTCTLESRHVYPSVVSFKEVASNNMMQNWSELLGSVKETLSSSKMVKTYLEHKPNADMGKLVNALRIYKDMQDSVSANIKIAMSNNLSGSSGIKLTNKSVAVISTFVDVVNKILSTALYKFNNTIRNTDVENPEAVEFANFVLEKIKGIAEMFTEKAVQVSSYLWEVNKLEDVSKTSRFKVVFTYDKKTKQVLHGVVYMTVPAAGWIAKQQNLLADDVYNTWVVSNEAATADGVGIGRGGHSIMCRWKANVKLVNDADMLMPVYPNTKQDLYMPVLTFGANSTEFANALGMSKYAMSLSLSIIATQANYKYFDQFKLETVKPTTRDYVINYLTKVTRNGSVYYDAISKTTKSYILSNDDIKYNYTDETASAIEAMYQAGLNKERSISIFVGAAGTGKTRALAGLVCRFVERNTFDRIFKLKHDDLLVLDTLEGRQFAQDNLFNGQKILVILEECAHLLKQRKDGESSAFMSFLLDCIDGPNSSDNKITWIVTGNVNAANEIDNAIIKRETRLGAFIYVDLLPREKALQWVKHNAPEKLEEFLNDDSCAYGATLDYLYNNYIENYTTNYTPPAKATKEQFAVFLEKNFAFDAEQISKEIDSFEKSPFYDEFLKSVGITRRKTPDEQFDELLSELGGNFSDDEEEYED